jgi:hypothetical protein
MKGNASLVGQPDDDEHVAGPPHDSEHLATDLCGASRFA